MNLNERFEFDIAAMECPNGSAPTGYYLDQLTRNTEMKCEECGAVFEIETEQVFYGRLVRIEEPKTTNGYPDCFGNYVDLVDSSNNWKRICEDCPVESECYHITFMEDVKDD